MREDGCDGEAAGAFYVHEEGAGGGDEGLELVLSCFSSGCGVEKIDCENHFCGWICILCLACVLFC